jgi:hypothetical protein
LLPLKLLELCPPSLPRWRTQLLVISEEGGEPS